MSNFRDDVTLSNVKVFVEPDQDLPMIERVARALEDQHNAGCATFNYPRLARAAIEAMRKPTPCMLEHGDMVVPSGFLWKREHADTSGTEEVYRAMIGAALNSE